MFVCPKCGFEDLPCWRNNKWQPYGQICKIHELESFDKELANRLRKETRFEDENYFYQLTKTGWVHRIRKEFKTFWTRGHFTEKYIDAREDPLQTKLGGKG